MGEGRRMFWEMFFFFYKGCVRLPALLLPRLINPTGQAFPFRIFRSYVGEKDFGFSSFFNRIFIYIYIYIVNRRDLPNTV